MGSLDLDNGCECLEDFEVVSNRKPMLIESFSAGYSFHSGKSNGLALTANKTDLLIAHGLKQHPNATKEAKIEITNNVDGIDEKKKTIVKKRKATIKEDNTDCTNKIVVAPSKRTSKRVKKESTSTPIVTQKPKIIKSTKKSAPNKNNRLRAKISLPPLPQPGTVVQLDSDLIVNASTAIVSTTEKEDVNDNEKTMCTKNDKGRPPRRSKRKKIVKHL